MTQTRLKTGTTVLAAIALLAIAQYTLQLATSAQTRATVQAPMYQVDPFWPKPLPNNWVMGSVVGLSVDSRDHVWITHRGNVAPKEAGMLPNTNGMQQPGASPPAQPGDKRQISSICCAVAPPILEFDPAGNLVSSWGGPGEGYQWPTSMHGITVDGKDNVWLTTNQGHQMLKFTRQGKFLLQVGREGQSKGNSDTANLNRAAEAEVDLAANEVYVADGYGNRRVIVFDADTGAYKRHWGAYGVKPDDTDPGPFDPAAPLPKVFRTVHCASLAADGLVYVCDRANNRIQVFRKDGTFVKETQVAKNTLGDGVIFDIAFSNDKPQRHLFISDGANHRIWTLLRDPLQVISHFGSGGRYPGQFYAPHNVSLDSKGNIYTVETYEGKRLQKFNYKGIGAVAATTN
jgi:DNA-binding beta-propeller fold protein YncE